MSKSATSLTGVERTFPEDEIIVSKTDLKGKLVYANELFLTIADYTEPEILGQPHNIIRHPDMPRCIFDLLWHTLKSGEELFAYVVNRTKYGDHYWVFAHVTPTIDTNSNIIGYHSSRRVPTQRALDVIQPLYKTLKDAERATTDRKQGLVNSKQILADMLEDKGLRYDQFMYSL